MSAEKTTVYVILLLASDGTEANCGGVYRDQVKAIAEARDIYREIADSGLGLHTLKEWDDIGWGCDPYCRVSSFTLE